MASVGLENIFKRYDNGFEAVQDLNLQVDDGEFLVLVGPSGCGKTTALRMIAGLEDITSGDLKIGERRVNEVAEAQPWRCECDARVTLIHARGEAQSGDDEGNSDRQRVLLQGACSVCQA